MNRNLLFGVYNCSFQPNEWKTFLYIAQVTSNKILLYSIFLRLSSNHSHWIMLNSYFLLRHSSLGQAKPLHSSALTHPLGKQLNPSQEDRRFSGRCTSNYPASTLFETQHQPIHPPDSKKEKRKAVSQGVLLDIILLIDSLFPSVYFYSIMLLLPSIHDSTVCLFLQWETAASIWGLFL